MPAQKIAPRPVQLGDAPAAGGPVHDAGADEIGPSSAEAAGHADDADGLVDVLPLAAADAHAIGEMQPVMLGAQFDRGDRFAVAHPLQAAHPAGAQAALAMQPVYVDRTAGFHLVATCAGRPSRSEAAHHAPPFLSKSFGNPAAVAIPNASKAATASARLAACQADQQCECSQAWPVDSVPNGSRGSWACSGSPQRRQRSGGECNPDCG